MPSMIWGTTNPEFVQEVLRRHGMVPTVRGRYVYALCPFHAEETPSFSIDPRTGYWRCWGCERRGTLVHLVAHLNAVDELDAIRLLKTDAYGAMDVPMDDGPDDSDAPVDVEAWWKDFPETKWEDVPRNHPVYQYLVTRRQFNIETLQAIGVKLNPYSRTYPVVFPIWRGTELVGFVKRRIDDEEERKYLFNRGFKAREMVAYYCVTGWEQKPPLLVEGYLDCLKALQYGYGHCVALFSWNIKDAQAQWLRAKNIKVVVGALDNTPTGREGVEVLHHWFVVRPFTYPGTHKKDVCDLNIHEFWWGLA